MRALTIPSEAAAAEQEFDAALEAILAEQFKGAKVVGTALHMPEREYDNYVGEVVFDFAAKRMKENTWSYSGEGNITTVVTSFAELEKNGAGNLVRAAQKAFQEKLKL